MRNMGGQRMEERAEREAGRCTIISDLVTCSGHDPQPCGTLCASQVITLSPCSGAPFLSHRQAPHPHTASYHRHPHMHPHTLHIHTHRETHTQSEREREAQSLQKHRHRKHGDPGAVLTHQAHGACGNSPESQLSSFTAPSTRWEPLGLLEAP